jgi:UDP-glucuronate 4-epimerase
MNILVTGSAGFIGSHVCKYFVKRGHSVIGIDNFDVNNSNKLKRLNLTNLQKNRCFKLHVADIKNKAILNRIFSSNKFDVVIHLAAKPGIISSVKHINDYYEVNVLGFLSLLEIMRINNVGKLIFAS